MKIRNGFVSNSSSSSFVIAVKNGKELTVEKLIEIFKVSADSPLYPLIKEIAKIMAGADKWTVQQYRDEYGYGETDELDANTEKEFNKGNGVIYEGSASDEGEGAELALVDMEIKYEDDDIYISKEGGY